MQLRVGVLRKLRLVRWRHDIDDTGMGLGRRDIERRHPAARDLARGDHRIEHAGVMAIRRIRRLAFDLQNPVAAGQRLADVRTMPGMARG